jgi:Pseudouridylate synthases, 23S RNA-specific
MSSKFTYPFCYTPDPRVVEAAERLISRISADPELHLLFAEGKMMGTLVTDREVLYAFSGTAGGRSLVEGFVPPIYDLQNPDGHFKKREAEISVYNRLISDNPSSETSVELKRLRKEMSNELQEWIFDQYKVLNAKGECRTIKEIFGDQGLVPPGGTGDCAAPKLLQYAYLHGLKPLAMGEFWYGASPSREVRHQGCFYPSCTGKCGPLLGFMLQGLDVEPNPLERDWELYEPSIKYQDDDIIVVDKPSGMLAVPGRTAKKSLQEWLSEHFGREVYSCHRLDMDTSGLMVFAFTLESKVSVEGQFAARSVEKQYLARLSSARAASRSLREGQEGTISLPLSLDYYDRPRQMVDFEAGKPAVTDFKVLEMLPNGEVDVLFTPHTGRTHQLRVHSAHNLGLGRPIKGDRLYGGTRDAVLHLKAVKLSFTHPVSGKEINISID